jgi:hypothetical protein
MRYEWGPDDLQRELTYDPMTGRIFRNSGSEVFTSLDRGYRKARLGNKTWYGHRVAWLLHYGSWPKFTIDHISGDRADNRIANLRDVPFDVNCRNKAVSHKSASGLIGIYKTNRPACWVPQISLGNKSIALGATPCLGVAIKRRREAEEQLQFHANHGRAS